MNSGKTILEILFFLPVLEEGITIFINLWFLFCRLSCGVKDENTSHKIS